MRSCAVAHDAFAPIVNPNWGVKDLAVGKGVSG